MTPIERPIYLNRLIERQGNGLIKIITGIRRCGKSFLLFELFYNYLLDTGVPKDHIIKIALDDDENEELLDRKKLGSVIRAKLVDESTYYILLDEIQLVEDFEKVLNGLNRRQNLDIYVTGSNSKFLSSDIKTEFRGRGDEVRIHPLTFREYLSAFNGSQDDAWDMYFTYGGLPLTLSYSSADGKANYLKNLFDTVYIADVMERNHFKNVQAMETLLSTLASSVGSLTSPLKLSNTFRHEGYQTVTDKTVGSYLNALSDAFLVNKAERYDVKGRKYIASPYKYYFEDIGLRNARLNFRQQEENHIMENIIYNELLVRGYNVDVGIVEVRTRAEDGSRPYKHYEVDFVCNQGNNRYYIQSAYDMPTTEKLEQEQRSLRYIPDSFKKIIITRNGGPAWRNEQGILILRLMDFLLDENSLDL